MNLSCIFDGKTVNIVKIEPSQTEGFVVVSYVNGTILKRKEVSISGNIATNVTILG
jgi:hypothetical protein